MKKIKQYLVAVLAVFFVSVSAHANQYEAIIKLHTDIAEIEQSLGMSSGLTFDIKTEKRILKFALIRLAEVVGHEEQLTSVSNPTIDELKAELIALSKTIGTDARFQFDSKAPNTVKLASIRFELYRLASEDLGESAIEPFSMGLLYKQVDQLFACLQRESNLDVDHDTLKILAAQMSEFKEIVLGDKNKIEFARWNNYENIKILRGELLNILNELGEDPRYINIKKMDTMMFEIALIQSELRYLMWEVVGEPVKPDYSQAFNMLTDEVERLREIAFVK